MKNWILIKLNFTHNFFEKEILSINQGFKKFSMHFPLAFLHVSIPSQGTDTVNKKLAVFTYVYFFVTEAQKSSKNKNHQPQLKNLTVSYIKQVGFLFLVELTGEKFQIEFFFYNKLTLWSNNISLNVLQQPCMSIWI